MIKIENLTIHYGGKKLFENFSLLFEKDKITCLIAPSGTGKTTLLNHIAKMQNKKSISYLFQEPRLLPWFSIQKNIEIILENHFSKKEVTNIAKTFLEKVGLLNRADDIPINLSGGEKQRVAMARAFALSSDLLLLDEAFQSQDLKLKIKLMELFEQLMSEKKRTVIMVTHDVREAFAIADKIIVLEGSPLQITQIIENKILHTVAQRYLNPNEKVRALEMKLIEQ
ncbi:MAG: ABC transporter ATP-binding protein [Treponema sp.]|nr:ABC transporter ATP-binding protein [Treponema sp.]